jgi:transketolase
MRNAFADEVTKLGAEDARVMLLSGDIGNKLFDRFKEIAPGRFLNCGIGEANMMGMAAGLALNGMRPVVYTITPFTTTRCFEQIRVDVCYHRAPVTIVGTGAGLSYADLGPTHHSCEDIAILRTLPDMMVVCPADVAELRLALRAALAQDRPVYMRIGKKGEPPVHAEAPAFALGRAITVRGGEDACLIGTGTMVAPLVKAAAILAERGISARVESFHTVKPLDTDRLQEIFGRYRTVAVAEEHGRIGGLAGAISEWCAAHDRSVPRFLSFGVPDEFIHYIGSQAYFRERLGLTPEHIAAAILEG